MESLKVRVAFQSIHDDFAKLALGCLLKAKPCQLRANGRLVVAFMFVIGQRSEFTPRIGLSGEDCGCGSRATPDTMSLSSGESAIRTPPALLRQPDREGSNTEDITREIMRRKRRGRSDGSYIHSCMAAEAHWLAVDPASFSAKRIQRPGIIHLRSRRMVMLPYIEIIRA
ncbi:hypothetical protein [Rhizobium binae]|uniref:hypothetical protein n=1 Tax=Rhizobium binae TaxID=1138190 RepID=UPI001C83233B|nr:hypothetical protein [Rhizobium binae]MBX4971091.1 hypothetical protein [Rhizobium binae]